MVIRSHSGTSYRFDPGALCLELLITGGPGAFRRYEVLYAPADLATWAERSRLEPTPTLDLTEQDVAYARHVRDALFRLAVARISGGLPEFGVTGGGREDLDVLNEAAAHPPLVPSIGGDGERRVWAGVASGAQLLSTVARDAVELLTGPYAERVRMCAGERCYLVYVDTSRPGRRRWCSMEHCGNRHKVRALRARQAGPTGSR
ncbi:CGNR zinc finger domain-containing protein [Streptomyces acidicola]|uniref:CGNR zinc finger domain-containing protein n=1 Tax=Streptomyces acidicola TaxID=2596892 RepID=UPI0037A89765